jgi:hypothetical protein
MKIIAFAILIFVALPFAQKANAVYDTIIVKQTVIDTVKFIDTVRISEYSVALKALEDSQKFYKDSFDHLLTNISIGIAIIGIIFTVIGLFNFKQTNDAKNLFKELEGKIRDGLEKLEKDQIKNNVFREISKIYLTSSRSIKLANGKEEILDYFHRMTFFYHILCKNEVELNEKDVAHFNAVNKVIDKYILSKYAKTNQFKISEDSHLIGFFLLSLQNIIEYCKKTYKKEQEKIVKETWEKSCDIFGGEDEVNKAIEYYKKNKRVFNI